MIRKAARRADEKVSPWVRAVLMAHIDLATRHPKSAVLEVIPSGNEVMCVRFRPAILECLEHAAKHENLSVAAWIRSVAVAAAKAVSP